MNGVLVVSFVFLWLIVLFNLLLTLALVRRVNHNASPMAQGLKVGEAMMPFTAQTLTEETVTHMSYAEHSIVLVFISTHCEPCRQLLSSLSHLDQRTRHPGIELVIVSGDNQTETQALVDEMQIQLPILIAPRTSNAFFDDFKITSTPYYYHINEQGTIKSAGYPGPHLSKWRALIKRSSINRTEAIDERRYPEKTIV